jgi:hypothetical protein
MKQTKHGLIDDDGDGGGGDDDDDDLLVPLSNCLAELSTQDKAPRYRRP